jgi:hypothetical protein
MKGRAIDWLPEELAWIEARKDWPRADLHRAFVAFWRRPDVTKQALSALCKRKGWLTGRTGRFEQGSAGGIRSEAHREAFTSAGKSTRFQKGSVPPNRKGFGDERITKDGYVEISVPEVNPHTGHARRYVQKHRWLWEKANGPVPEGHRLKCLDGNKLNTDPANWKAIPYALAPRLNGRFGRGYDAAPEEIKPLILATAELEHAAREARRKARA